MKKKKKEKFHTFFFASEFYSFLAMRYVFSCLFLIISFPYCQVGISAQSSFEDEKEVVRVLNFYSDISYADNAFIRIKFDKSNI